MRHAIPARVKPNLWTVAAAALALLAAACGKDSHAATRRTSDDPADTPRAGSECTHAACGNNFLVDAAPGAPRCQVGATCSVTLTLVATGAFHINEEYPYKFKADDAPGLEFLGTDAAGKNVFSKAAGNWQKKDEKTGTMTVAFRPAAAGSKTVAGTFKLSVCSAQSCQLEQQVVTTTVAVQ
jgi:hypothetical protein